MYEENSEVCFSTRYIENSLPSSLGVNVLTTVNSTSLDQLICCFQPASAPISALQLRGSNNINGGTSFHEVFATALVGQSTATTPNGITAGDSYNQCVFQK